MVYEIWNGIGKVNEVLKYLLLFKKKKFNKNAINTDEFAHESDEQYILIIQGILNWYDRRNSRVIFCVSKGKSK